MLSPILGAFGSCAVELSYIANTFITSGIFNDISLSWTRVPYILLYVNPSFNVVDPVPEETELDLLIISDVHLL